jgi:hypothetical protein
MAARLHGGADLSSCNKFAISVDCAFVGGIPTQRPVSGNDHNVTADSVRTARLAAMPVLRTKLSRPPIPADFVPRPQLIQQLSAQRDRPLILVSAPAGLARQRC